RALRLHRSAHQGTQPMSSPLSTSVEVGTATACPPLATGFWRRALRHRSFVVGGTLSLMVLGAALLSLVWTPWSAYEIDVASKLRPPSATHWLRATSAGRGTPLLVARGR